MPYSIRPVGEGMYQVINAESGTVHARHTTLAKAEKQVRLLYGLEHGMKPYGESKSMVKSHFHRRGDK